MSWLGGTTAGGTVLAGRSDRKLENHCSRAKWGHFYDSQVYCKDWLRH